MRLAVLRRPLFIGGVALGFTLAGCVHEQPQGPGPLVSRQSVGRVGANLYQLPNGQMITPAGQQVELPGMRPQSLALSPDGHLLATSGKKSSLVLINPADGKILQTVELSTKKKGTSETTKFQMSFAGLVFAPDSKAIYLSTTSGDVWGFTIDSSGKAGNPKIFQVPQANVPRQKNELPTGIAVSQDGNRLYVAGNFGNRLHEIDAKTGKALRSWETGVAPYDVLLFGDKAYVSSVGGRRPGSGDLTAHAGKGTRVRVDPVRHIANEGSVTVIDLEAGKVKTELGVGLHACALAVSPNGNYVVVANSGSDTLNVIDTATDCVIEKIWTRQTPADPFGAQPSAMAFDSTGERLYVCNGSQNAVAVIEFEPRRNASAVIGLIPTGWFPGGIQFDSRRKALYVSNMKGIGATKETKAGEQIQLTTGDFFGTISLIKTPGNRELQTFTKSALHNMHYPKLQEVRLPARPNQPARPVPERTGEPSTFKHVIYVIKENRTYDQILGDMPEGNGDTNLCVFGERYTPNLHKIAREFVLLDNTYCAGVQSADGHQWTDSSIANEYMERQITSSTPRSYPGGKTEDGADALAWASSGFIWDNAMAHGVSFRNFGEWMLSEAGWKDPNRKDPIEWSDYWKQWQNGTDELQLRSRPAVESMRGRCNTNTVGWDLKVPDVMRAAEFIRELRQFETNGNFPQLTIIFLPNDHTSGTRAKYPTPGSQVADNDLAFGHIVEAVTHSRFWPETCLIAIEDDPQNGWDHVSGYRTTCYVVSPYTKRGKTISTQYNQPGVLRTIELILGLPPMNQLDGTATPMFDCFTTKPDYTPYKSVLNLVRLDELNPSPKNVPDSAQRKDAIVSNRLPLDEVDRCPEDVFNRILWRAMRQNEPYPNWAIKAVEDDDD